VKWLVVAVFAAGCHSANTAIGARHLEAADPNVGGPRAVIHAFVAAVQARSFGVAHALLAKPLRERYTPARLEHDFLADPSGALRVQMISARQETSILNEHDGVATLQWAEGHALRLEREPKGWRIAALE
jgi:hypothetical protein